jgi:cysteine synthase
VFSLVTFDAIGSTDVCHPSAGSLGAPVNVAAAHHGWTAHIFMLSDMKFSRSKRENKKPPH